MRPDSRFRTNIFPQKVDRFRHGRGTTGRGGPMSDAPETRLSLLLRLRNRDDGDAWSRFVDVYGPLVYGQARRHGLSDADAADRMQEVLLAVARGVERYDAGRGPFRKWLFTVTMNKLRSYWKQQRNAPEQGADLEQVPDA